MAILRKNKKSDYTIIDNNVFRNKTLSLKAKGMICTMLSLPDDWEFSEIGLTKLSNDSRTSIRSTLKELMEYGYLVRGQIKSENGKFANAVYTIYEEPLYQNPTSEKPTSENEHNKILNNKELNNKKESNNINIITKERFKKPTLEEVQEYCKERSNSVDAQTFIDFYESKGWKVGNTPMKDWKACVRTWERNRNNKKEIKETKVPEWFDKNLNKEEEDNGFEEFIRNIGICNEKEKPIIINYGKGTITDDDVKEIAYWDDNKKTFISDTGIWSLKLLYEIARGEVEDTTIEES